MLLRISAMHASRLSSPSIRPSAASTGRGTKGIVATGKLRLRACSNNTDYRKAVRGMVCRRHRALAAI